MLCAGTMLSAQPTVQTDTATLIGHLDNGLTYYIRNNKTPENRADFYIVQRVGAILEEDNQNGLAHFLEHMAFNGTKNFPGKGIINCMESHGVKFGENVNAYTSTDETVYNLSNVPTNVDGLVDSALLILHDWSGFISLEGEEIDNERGVIREEWRTRNTGQRRVYTQTIRNTMPGTQYAKRDVIGDTAVINNFSYDELRAYYRKWYRPDLQAVVIVGDIDPKDIEARITRMWSDIPAPAPDAAKRIFYTVPDNAEPIASVVTDPELRYGIISLSYRFDPMPDAEKTADPLKALMEELSESIISRIISNRLDDLSKKAGSPFVYGMAGIGNVVKTKGELGIYMVPAEGKISEAFDLLIDEAEKIKRFGFGESETERAKAQIASELENAYNERNTTKTEVYVQRCVDHFLEATPMPDALWECKFFEQFGSRVSAEYLSMAARHLMERNVVITYKGPKKEGVDDPKTADLLAAFASAPERELTANVEEKLDGPLVETEPKPGKIKKESATGIDGVTRWTLTNGMDVYVKPTDFKNDEIRLMIYSKGGRSLVSIDDLPSSFVAGDVVEMSGLGKYSSSDLQKMLAGKNVAISTSIGTTDERIKGVSSVKDFETMLQLAYLYFTGLRTDSSAYAATIEQYNTLLVNASLDPQRVFSDSVASVMANGNPYSSRLSLETLAKVELGRTMKVQRERFANPGDFTVFIVGNIDTEAGKAAVCKWIGGLKTTKAREQCADRNIGAPKGRTANNFERELKVDKTSSYTAYTGSLDYTMRNNICIDVLACVLDIRYLESIREREGGTYGVSTYATVRRNPKPEYRLIMVFDTDPAKFEKLLGIIHDELRTIAANGPLKSDFDKVIGNLRKKRAENLRENEWWLGTLTEKIVNGYDRLDGFDALLDSLTPDDIKAMAQKVLDDANIVEVSMSPKH